MGQSELMGEQFWVFFGDGGRLNYICENLKTKFTFFFLALVVDTASKFLSILKDFKVLKISWLSGVDGSSLNISLAVAQGGPTLHSLPEKSLSVFKLR